ncbi:T9SS C-terminal target domain-containing protein [Kordia algicida OT-1]|uniref:CHU large protein gliding motility-related protein possible adhesin AidA-related n=1 Tax=Kordia algicida OT-1 TaxID=391587 RepID=A9DNC3_9FLAO|nr:T9SS C-terminal target domain-containing protein [Kordia algicida]EDP97158.1 CHU large protein; gliding motility-related protein; possible adhesin AidA-related [Kordia algicida OT-1]
MPNATISVDVTTVCQYNDSPIITFTGSAGTAPYTFTYTIGTGASQTVTSTGDIATIEVPTNTDGTFTYTLTQVQDAVNPMPTVISSQAVTIDITLGPDPEINGPGEGEAPDGTPVFSLCDSSGPTLSFSNASSTRNTININYTIDWGDGTPNFVGSDWGLLDHDYAPGTYNMIYTIEGNNNCTTVQEYIVFIGSNPAVLFGSAGNDGVICSGSSLTIPIDGTENNPPETTYTISFNDGSPDEVYNHPPPENITHVFTTSSCGTSSNGFSNSFSATMVAENLCRSTEVQLVPIYVATQAEAEFSGPTDIVCTDTEVCFQNSSTGNEINGGNGSCDTSPSIVWDISPNTFTLGNGSQLGDDFDTTNTNLWSSGSDELCINFTAPGTYTIALTAGNTCGIDTTTQTICVEAPVNPQFTLSSDNGCTPLDVTTTNNTDESTSCNPPTYEWQVTYTADFCGTGPEVWSFTNGTSATSANPSFNFVTPGTYTIQLIGTNEACGSETSSQQVIVKQPPTVSINPIDDLCNANSINPTAMIANCTDDPSSVTYSWQFAGANTTSSNLESPGTIDYPSPGTYTVTLQVTNDCGVSEMAMETFTIQEVPVITNTDLTQDICSGASSAEINLTSTNPSTTYTWTATATAGISGFITAGTSSTIPSQIITTSNTSSGTVTYTVTPSINGCDGTAVDFIITVNPAPEITTQPQSSTVCQNGTPITLSVATSGVSAQYQWFSNTIDSNTGGTPIAGATNADFDPPTGTVGVLYYYCEITFTSGGCSSLNSQTARVEVTPNASITSQPTATQSLCVGSTIDSPLSVAFTGGTGTVSYQWFSNTTNSNTGGTSISGATNSDYTPPTFTTAGNYYYYVELSFAGSGCDDIISDVAEIIVVDLPIINMQPLVTQSLCQNTPSQLLEVQASGGLGTFSYQWFSNTSNSNIGGTVIAGETNSTFTPPTNTVGTLYYYCVISQAASESCIVTSDTAEVIVNAAPLINSQPQSQELCLGDVINTLTVSYANGVGTPTYQWYSNTVDDTTSGTAITGETTDSYTPDVSAVSTTYYYCIITFASGGCPEVTSNTAEIIVNETPSVSNFTETLCSGNSFTIIPDTSNGDIVPTNTTYTWGTPAISPSGSVTGATAETTPQTEISQFLTNTTDAVATVTYTVTPSAGNCDGTPFTIEITLNAAPEVTMQPQPSTVCIDGTPNTLSITLGNTSDTPQYQWYSNTTDSTTGGTPIAGATTADYDPPTDTIGEIYYYCEITFTSGGCSLITSQTALVTVTPNATITDQPTMTESLCVGSTIDSPLSVVFTDGTGTVSYQWFSNTTNSNTGGTAIAGATNADYTPPVYTTAGTFYYYVALSFAGSGCNDVISDVAEVVVVDAPVIDVQPIASQTLCQNSVPQDLEVQASGGLGTFTYQWFSNTVNSNTGGTAITGETNAIFTPPTTTVGTLYYYCTVSQAASESCTATSNPSEVIINLGPQIDAQPQSQELCTADTVNALTINYSNGVGTPTYQWYSNTVNDTTTGTAITGATTDSYTPDTSLQGTTYYYCIITFSSGGCSEIISDTAEIIVNETPSVSNFTETICSGNSFTITPDASNGDIVPTNTTYTWSAPTIVPAGSITGASAENTPQTNISQTLTNTTTSSATVTYTVTPTAGICEGTPFTVEITVNPAISANTTITQIDCFGANNGEIVTNISGGVPFTTGTPYIISWTGPNGFTASDPTISNLVPGDYTLSVQDEGGCPFSETYTIAEPEELIVTVDDENSISCFGANDGEILVTVTGGTLDYVYNWTRNGIAFSMDEDISNLSAATYELTVTDANGCGPVIQSFVITEPDELMASVANQTNVACFGETSGAIDINVTGGTPTETAPGVFEYTYAWTGPNGFTSNSQNIDNLAGGTYNLSVTDENGCDDTLSVVLMQPDEIVITTEATELMCFGDNDAMITITDISGGSGSYTITWSNFGEGMMQNNLSAGDYTITVTDSNDCTAAVTVTIEAPPIFTIEPVVQQISCFGANDGSINLNFQGGQDPIEFEWADDPNAGVERNNLGPGTYTINIVDGTPCTITETFIIIEPAELTLSANITNALDCDDASSGAINLLISGGSEPFMVSWSNGATTEDLDNITAGDYLVTVVDANGCEATDTYTIIRPPEIIIDVDTETIVNCNAFTASQRFTAQVSGGVPPYTLNWSSGTVTGANDEMMTTSQNGLVILEATDGLGCVSNYTFEVDIPEYSDADFSLTSTAFETFGIYSQIDPIQFTNTTTGDYTNVSWDFGDGNFSNEENPIHSYSSPGAYTVVQTVTFPEGCVYTKVITLLIEKGYKLIMPNAFTPNEDGLNDRFKPVFIGLDEMELNIYDTWGSLIYSETGDNIQGWDGKVKDEFVENGNYYYTFTAKTFFGTTVREKGPLTLIL